MSLIELPRQNLLSTRKLSLNSLIWADTDIENFENEANRKKLAEQAALGKDISYHVASDCEQALDLVERSLKAVLIIAGKLVSQLIPKLAKLQQKPGLAGVIVYCMDLKTHSEWA